MMTAPFVLTGSSIVCIVATTSDSFTPLRRSRQLHADLHGESTTLSGSRWKTSTMHFGKTNLPYSIGLILLFEATIFLLHAESVLHIQ